MVRFGRFCTKCILIVCAFMLTGLQAQAQKSNKALLKQMLLFGETHPEMVPDTLTDNIYTKYSIKVVRRNAILAAVPTMFYILRDGRRKYLSESYSRVTFTPGGQQDVHRYLHLSTVYHRHNTLPSMLKYLTPTIYAEQLYKDGILSPINYHNRKFYRYRMKRFGDGTSIVLINGRFRNTQLVRRGYVTINDSTGQVIDFNFEGEYDMIHSVLSGTMRSDSLNAMLPLSCNVIAKLQFLGNIIHVHYTSMYNQPATLPDSITDSRDRSLMDSLRPMPLSDEELAIVEEFDSVNKAQALAKAEEQKLDSIEGVKPKKRNWAKYIMWDLIGDNVLNRIKAKLGDDQGQIRVSPIFNPLYFGYSKRKGFVYRLDLRGYYNFTNNHNISMRVKMGYSFKQHQLFYRIPLQWTFNKRKNGYVLMEFSNGNRITNSRVLENVKSVEHADSIDWDKMNLDYFRDTKFRIGVNHDVIKRMLGVQLGFNFYRRSAVDKRGFQAAGRPTTYRTSAPYLQLGYRPLTDSVPLVITAQWERGLKTMGGNVAYDRFEFDGQYIHDMSRMRSWQLRAGLGFYTRRGHDDYFLDYYNFHEDYLTSGWSDEWSGEFELLNSNWYNASDYYFRTNATYESPLLLLSFVPAVGKIVEKERVYISGLAVRRMLPYIECGYGFTNRVFSVGFFTGFSNLGFEGAGLKFGFELFDNY